MQRNDLIQSAIVAYLKSQATVLAELKDPDEIREDQWQGSTFTYPNIRVRLISNIPLENNCDGSTVVMSILAFSEEASSHEADRIAGIINTALCGSEEKGKSFEYQSIRFSTFPNNLIPAIRSDKNTWRSEVLIRATVSG